eukprot:829279_1
MYHDSDTNNLKRRVFSVLKVLCTEIFFKKIVLKKGDNGWRFNGTLMVQDVTDHQSQMHRVKVKDTPMEEVVIGQKAEQCLGIEKNLKKQRCIMDRIVNRELECIFLFSPTSERAGHVLI